MCRCDRMAEPLTRDYYFLREVDVAHHYDDSGLDNVFLENGYSIHETAYGPGVSIQDTEGLRKAIGRWLIATPKPLNGAELRFLRSEMELTQRDLAGILGTTEQTLRLWEKHRKKGINGSADLLLRALYSECMGRDGSVRSMVERLGHLDQLGATEARMRETDHGWEVVHACAA